MDYTPYSTEALKAIHNASLHDARNLAEQAKAIRAELTSRDSSLRGPSTDRLATAVESLYVARTFANAPYDLPASDNPYRHLRGRASERRG